MNQRQNNPNYALGEKIENPNRDSIVIKGKQSDEPLASDEYVVIKTIRRSRKPIARVEQKIKSENESSDDSTYRSPVSEEDIIEVTGENRDSSQDRVIDSDIEKDSRKYDKGDLLGGKL